ncbi:hypothetical protein CPLU01_00098 [Colletotrichum plurivorum]|uniref:Uncharacterized protein n=1 Tax=Colletotrichum plurivorum TaxID=2175906 RepID=A0A8H6NSY5_9PEZI|nr:hypothetical protein CPLU01_00098 [Colletotrichum plurivorum]
MGGRGMRDEAAKVGIRNNAMPSSSPVPFLPSASLGPGSDGLTDGARWGPLVLLLASRQRRQWPAASHKSEGRIERHGVLNLSDALDIGHYSNDRNRR